MSKVSLTFDASPGTAFTVADAVKARYTQLASEIEKLAKVKLQPSFTNAGGSSPTVTKTIVDPVKKAEDEIRKIRQATIQDALRNDAILARASKSLADVQVKEGRRVANAAIADLKEQEAARKRALPPSGSGSSGDAGGAFVSGLNPIAGAAVAGGAAGAGAAAALAAIDLTKAAVTSLAQETLNLGVASVKLAADYQTTVNAMTVFTGSTRLAKQELAGIAKLAADTPGLRLEDAEQGAVRLRALGFQASVANDLVAGLAKQKLLSGADDGAIQRVIVNLTQVSTGSPRLSQDIKEMILALPTLRQNLIDTFGSIDKFKKAVETDPDAALKKFAVGLKATAVPAAGFNDALGKLSDSFVQAGREFGKPLLDPITTDVKSLTKFILENRDTVGDWGKFVADTIRGASDIVRGGAALTDNTQGSRSAITQQVNGFMAAQAKAIFAGTPLGAAGLIFGGLSDLGKTSRERDPRKPLTGAQQKLQYFLPRDADLDAAGDVFSEQQTARLNADRDAKRKAERDKAQRLATLKDESDAAKAAIENDFKVREAKLTAYNQVNRTNEFQAAREAANLRTESLNAQLAATKDYYTKLKATSELSGPELISLEKKRATEIGKINAELSENAIKLQADLVTKARETFGSTSKLFGGLSLQVNADNPIATLLLQGDDAARQLKETLRGLPPELQKIALSMQAVGTARQLATASLNATLSGLRLRQRADEIRNPIDQKKVEEATARSQAIYQFENKNYTYLKRKEYEQFRTVDPIGASLKSFNEFVQEDLDKTTKGAFRTQESVALENLRSNLTAINAKGKVGDDQKAADAAVVALAGNADLKGLNAGERADIAQSFERQAITETNFFIKAQEERVKHTTLLTEIRDRVSGSSGVAQNKLDVSIDNKAPNATVQYTKQSPTAADTANNYDPENIFGHSFNGVPGGYR